MADKGKGKADDHYGPWQRRRERRRVTQAVYDNAGTSSRTSGRTATAGGGGNRQELPPGASSQFSGAPGVGGGSGLSLSQWRPPRTTLQQPLSDQGGGSAPLGIHAPSGQNQIANPWQTGTGLPHGNSGAPSSQFWGGGGGDGSGAGFSQFAHGHGGFSQLHSSPPAATLGNNSAGGSGSAPFGIHAPSGQNGNPWQPHGNSGASSSSQFGGGGSGAGYGGFYQSTPMLRPPVGNPGLGHGGFSQPAPMLQRTLGMGNPAFHAGEPSTPAARPTSAAPVERRCTICRVPTPLLWSATNGNQLPLCEDCRTKIFAGGRPLQHLEQYLTSTAAGCGAGSIPAFLAAHGYGGGYSHSHGYEVLMPGLSPWCVCCNFLAELFWEWVPMCRPCYNLACSIMASYDRRLTGNRPQQALTPAQAQAQLEAQMARGQQAYAQARAQQALAQGRGIVIGQPQQRQLDHGQPSSAAPAPERWSPLPQVCGHCGALEPTRISGGIPLCEKCFN